MLWVRDMLWVGSVSMGHRTNFLLVCPTSYYFLEMVALIPVYPHVRPPHAITSVTSTASASSSLSHAIMYGICKCMTSVQLAIHSTSSNLDLARLKAIPGTFSDGIFFFTKGTGVFLSNAVLSASTGITSWAYAAYSGLRTPFLCLFDALSSQPEHGKYRNILLATEETPTSGVRALADGLRVRGGCLT